MAKKYKIIVQNNDVSPDAETDTRNIQFFSNDKLVNLPENEPVIVSEATYNNLKDTVQTRYKSNKEKTEITSYEFKRFPVTLLEIIDEPDTEVTPGVKVEEKKVDVMPEVKSIKIEEMAEATA